MKRYLVALLSAALLGLAPVSMASAAPAGPPTPSTPGLDAFTGVDKTPGAWAAAQRRSARATAVETVVLLELSQGQALHNTALTLTGGVLGWSPEINDWAPVPSGTVTLHRRWKGTQAWVSLGSHTIVGELFTYSFRASRNADYRVTYNGGAYGVYTFNTSETTLPLGVARRFKESITKRTLVFKGRIVPSYARKAIVIQRKTCATCSWKRYAKVRTDKRSRWSKKLTAPRGFGQRWYFRAVAPGGAQYLQSYSRVAETFRRR